jgi:hypothetical protein
MALLDAGDDRRQCFAAMMRRNRNEGMFSFSLDSNTYWREPLVF